MPQTIYIRPIALAQSPQSEEGEAVRIAGGLTYASRFAVLVRENGRIVSRQRLGAGEVPHALSALPDALAADGAAQWEALTMRHAPLDLKVPGGNRMILLPAVAAWTPM